MKPAEASSIFCLDYGLGALVGTDANPFNSLASLD